MSQQRAATRVPPANALQRREEAAIGRQGPTVSLQRPSYISRVERFAGHLRCKKSVEVRGSAPPSNPSHRLRQSLTATPPIPYSDPTDSSHRLRQSLTATPPIPYSHSRKTLRK